MVKYYNLSSASAQADSVKKQIVALSVGYGVISPFTSFSNPGNTQSVEGRINYERNMPSTYRMDGNFPNPFNPTTTIRFTVASDIRQIVRIRIYNSLGQMVDELFVSVNGSGTYSVLWNAATKNGVLPSGAYIAVVDFGDQLLAQKMMLMK